MDYVDWTPEQLRTRIEELEALLRAMRQEEEDKTQLDFPWTGNLGHWYWNAKTNSVEFNPQKAMALGFDRADIPATVNYQFFTERLHPEDYERVMDNMRDHLYGRSAVYECEYRIRTKEGYYKWFYDRGKITTRDAEGKPLLVCGIVFDISEKKELEEKLLQQNRELQELARIDSLTGLLNAHTIRECLAGEMKRASRQKTSLAVALMDIDDFKKINDTRGHPRGDQVLETVGTAIKSNIRETDLAGRYGGDEFLVLFPGGDEKNAAEAIQRIRRGLRQNEDELAVSVSVGLAQRLEADDPLALIARADAAMYREKSAKKGGNHGGEQQI